MLTVLLVAMSALFLLTVVRLSTAYITCRALRLEVSEFKLGAGPVILKHTHGRKTNLHLGLIPTGGHVWRNHPPGLRPPLVSLVSCLGSISFIYGALAVYWQHRGWGWLTPAGFGEHAVATITGMYTFASTMETPSQVEHWMSDPTAGFAVYGLLSLALVDCLITLTPLGHVGWGLLVGAFEARTGKVAWDWTRRFGRICHRRIVFSLLVPLQLVFLMSTCMATYWLMRPSTWDRDWSELLRRKPIIMRD